MASPATENKRNILKVTHTIQATHGQPRQAAVTGRIDQITIAASAAAMTRPRTSLAETRPPTGASYSRFILELTLAIVFLIYT